MELLCAQVTEMHLPRVGLCTQRFSTRFTKLVCQCVDCFLLITNRCVLNSIFKYCALTTWADSQSDSVTVPVLHQCKSTYHCLYVVLLFIIYQIFSLARDWSRRVIWLNMPAKTGEYLSNVLQFSKDFACCENIWRVINRVASIWHEKYAWTFVRGHYLFLEAHSVLRTSLSKSCSLLGTENVRGFSRQRKAIIYL